MHTGKHLSKHSDRKAHTRTFNPQTAEWMDGATGVVVNNAHIHTLLLLSLPPLPLAHIRVPLSSHRPLYSKPPASFPLLLSPGTVRRLSSHSIMLLLDAFSFPHFTHIRFPSLLSSPSFNFFLLLFHLKHMFNFPFPFSLLISPPFP